VSYIYTRCFIYTYGAPITIFLCLVEFIDFVDTWKYCRYFTVFPVVLDFKLKLHLRLDYDFFSYEIENPSEGNLLSVDYPLTL